MSNDSMKELLGLADTLDADDALAPLRARFEIPQRAGGGDALYLCGNSLGLMPKGVRAAVAAELDDWARLGVDGHLEARRPWLPYHEQFAAPLARIVGALPSEVVVMNSLTANLHLLMVSFYRPTPERFRIAIEAGAFPSDRYAVGSQIAFHGFDPRAGLLELTPRHGEDTLRTEDVVATLEREGDSIALVLLGAVQYYTGQFFDVASIAKAARARGIAVGLDLAHAAGNVPLSLHDWDADFAVWCGYKYLNAGPGAGAGAFVHERHARRFDLPRFAGWWGHEKEGRFRMPHDFEPLAGAEGWQLSNPPILPMAALSASLAVFEAAGMPALRAKSEALTAYLESLIDAIPDRPFSIVTPREPAARGAQISLRAPRGRALYRALGEAGVACDWREPDVVRVAPVPLYNRFAEVREFAAILARHAAAA